MGSTSGTLVGFAKLTGTILKETLAHPLTTSIIEIHEKDSRWEITVVNGTRKPEGKVTESEQTESDDLDG